MKCPHCNSIDAKTIKIGSFLRVTPTPHRVQRYRCKGCRREFCDYTGTIMHWDKRPDLYEKVFLHLCSSVSQRRAAILEKTTRETIARKMVKLSLVAAKHLEADLGRLEKVKTIAFDELETHEHTKCKPISIILAVEDKTRRILAVKAAPMPGRGLLAKRSVKQYGKRKDERVAALHNVLERLQTCTAEGVSFKSDLCPRYPSVVHRHYKGAEHKRYKGRKPKFDGLGELKKGRYDPLFYLNHTCAMFRDNLKTLSRKTWCSTKRLDRLQCRLNLYHLFHNYVMLNAKKPSDWTGLIAELIVSRLPHTESWGPV